MRPQAPDLHLAELSEEERTPAENPLAKFIADAMRRGFHDFEGRLPEILKPLLSEVATHAAKEVINALGPRLYELESDVRRLTESERRSGEWRLSIERRLTELERGARTRETMPSPPPSEGP